MAVGIEPHGADAWPFKISSWRKSRSGPRRNFVPQRATTEFGSVSSPTNSDGRLPAVCGLLSPGDAGLRYHPNRSRHEDVPALLDSCWTRSGRGNLCAISIGRFSRYLALESHQQKVMVIGEDLGTATPAIRARFFRDRERQHFQSKGSPAAAVAIPSHDFITIRGDQHSVLPLR